MGDFCTVKAERSIRSSRPGHSMSTLSISAVLPSHSTLLYLKSGNLHNMSLHPNHVELTCPQPEIHFWYDWSYWRRFSCLSASLRVFFIRNSSRAVNNFSRSGFNQGPTKHDCDLIIGSTGALFTDMNMPRSWRSYHALWSRPADPNGRRR